MTIQNICLSSRGQVTLVLTFGVYLIIANRSHFNQILVHALDSGKHRAYSTMNVLYQVSYMAVQVPASLYADRYSPVSVLAAVMLGMAATSMVAPFVLAGLSAWSSESEVISAGLMTINGALVGSWWPFMNIMLSNWAPPEKLAYMYAATNTGVPGGIALGNVISGLFYTVCEPVFYYSFFPISMVCTLWSVMLLYMFYSNPSNDPGIQEKELEYLTSSIQPKIKLPIPWFKIVTSLPVWCLLFANFGSTLFYTVLIMYMPVYLKNVMKVNITKNGIMCAIPSLGQIFFMYVAGSYASYIQKNNWMDVTKIRKVITFIGMIVPSCILLMATVFPDEHYVFYGMLVMAYSISGCVFSGFRVSQIEMAPNFVAPITALCDSVGSLAMNTVHIVFFIIGHEPIIQNNLTWNKICWGMCLNLLVSSLPFVCFGSSEPQSWNMAINT